MFPHTPKQRSITQHRFDFPQRCFRPFHNVLVTEIRQCFRFLLPHRFRKWQYRPGRNFTVTDQIMNACPFPRPFGKIPFQMFLVRTVKRHLFTPATERHIERFSIQRLGRHHDVFSSPSLRLVRRRHPAVIERRVVLRHVDQLTRSAVRIKYFDLAGIGAHMRQRPVVNFFRFQVHPELDQITRAKFDFAQFPDVNEIGSSLRKNPLAVGQYQLLAVYGFNARYLTGFADAFHVADEADGHARLEVRSVLQPCFRFVP